MDWKLLIAELRDRRLKQAVIAAECGCTQSTISDLSTGTIKVPNFVIGQNLLRLQKASNREIDRIRTAHEERAV